MGVISTVKATYQALTVYAQTYVDATPRTAAESAQRVIAAWVTQLRDDMFEISDALAGDLPITAAGIVARFRGAPATGFNAEADSSVYGDGSGSEGLSFFTADGSPFVIAVRNSASQFIGRIRYTAASGWQIRHAGIEACIISGARFAAANNQIMGGPSTLAWRYLAIQDGSTAPGAVAGAAAIYVDSADGDLKVVFSDGTVKTIATDT